MMKVIRTELQGLLIIEPEIFKDQRGFFLETYQQTRFYESGIPHRFVQDNLSFSVKGTLRGLHFQVTRPQAKLVQAVTGEIFDVAVDIRPASETFGKWSGTVLSEDNQRQLFIPRGFAHGFCVLSKFAHVTYKCSDFYNPQDEAGILWSDPAVGIDWPVENPIVSQKDRALPLLSEIPVTRLSDPREPS
jgi:dTDP-4-dehydrorhamnose 3,5-epimerase